VRHDRDTVTQHVGLLPGGRHAQRIKRLAGLASAEGDRVKGPRTWSGW
jgi:hypothetical protein